MPNTMSRILIETILKKALREMQDSPERSIRNLVDLALTFANGRFQRVFFEAAQTTLQKENNPYYNLIRDAVSHIDSQKLLTLGMNIGYNSCTRGAQIIRDIEDTYAFNVPWCISLHINPQVFHEKSDIYCCAVEQGMNLGIYIWQLFPANCPQELLSLPECYPDCAFTLLCQPEDINPHLINAVCNLNNTLLLVSLNENTPNACKLLRQHRLPYGLCCSYTEQTAASILNGELFAAAESLHAVFTLLHASSDCPDTVRQTVYDHILTVRKQQLAYTIPWEFVYDNCFVDSIISDDSCFAGVDPSGQLHTLYSKNPLPGCNLFENDLFQILQRAFPKNTIKE